VFALVNENADRRCVILERFILMTVEFHGVAEARKNIAKLRYFCSISVRSAADELLICERSELEGMEGEC
jgi:hypothetical protein